MTAGRMSPQAALDELRKRMTTGKMGTDWSFTEAVFRELRKRGYDASDVRECFLDENAVIPENATGRPTRKPGVSQCTGWHYEYHAEYCGEQLYLKFRIAPEGMFEVTSFKRFGQAY